MSEDGYRGGGTLGGRWGCALSAVVGLPLIAGVFVLAALGDCAPGVECHRGPNWRLLAGAILIAIGIGFGTRLFVNVTFRRLRALAREQEADAGPGQAE
ncbi:hypothetical protein [Sphingomonas sp.]|uniref:hypothetical protein n=1 Tax=Sphingomonas sp. TaxID=28214 RepID=UPI000DB556A5|nr:hypothetical protein [Sphingomonas sp.]PZU09690.1 MAG: hypothetical protein DI605_08505 [Sphingomonas sp.]